jgi:hypothetical protein
VAFDSLQMLVQDQGQDVVVKLLSDHLVISDAETGDALRTIAYAQVDSAFYEVTRQPAAKRTGIGGALKGALSAGGRLFGAGKHYVTVTAGGQTIVLHAGRDWEALVAAFEERSGIKVKR